MKGVFVKREIIADNEIKGQLKRKTDGYIVLWVNYRGSSNYGEGWQKAITVVLKESCPDSIFT